MSESTSVQRTDMEKIRAEQSEPEIEVEAGIGGAAELQAELEATAESADVTGFKCVHEKCGLTHGHSTNKHRASDSSDMSMEEAAQMEATSVCHCGLNNMAHAGHKDAPSPSQANRTAPIPDEMARHLEQNASV